MGLLTKGPRGTQDVLPKESYQWQVVEDAMRRICSAYGFKEIRTPVFEHTELFQRSVGETTDVVQKEMYTFQDKGGRSITLRPEGTAGAVRAMVEHGLYNDALPIKAYYFTSCYRYEKPQAGRLREFHQFGVEVFGAGAPSADAEVICLAKSVFDVLGVKNLSLEINSIGCPKCRAEYHKALKEYFQGYQDQLCETCLGRLNRNPMRILDCKSPICSKIAADAPIILDYLCDECSEHFQTLQSHLKALQIDFTINPKIVRGLDYYTKTVFEFVTTEIGAQGTVCGGGRYDGLIGQLGGADTPALGFAMGLERLLLTMQQQGCNFLETPPCDLYIAPMDAEALPKAMQLAQAVRESGYQAEYDLMHRGLKAQMKYANKIHATYVLVLGGNELEQQSAKLKQMETGEQIAIPLDDRFAEAFDNIAISHMFQNTLQEEA